MEWNLGERVEVGDQGSRMAQFGSRLPKAVAQRIGVQLRKREVARALVQSTDVYQVYLGIRDVLVIHMVPTGPEPLAGHSVCLCDYTGWSVEPHNGKKNIDFCFVVVFEGMIG